MHFEGFNKFFENLELRCVRRSDCEFLLQRYMCFLDRKPDR